jgi:hypothetical protein
LREKAKERGEWRISSPVLHKEHKESHLSSPLFNSTVWKKEKEEE